MSDNIPFDIQTEIIKRVLDVKSLIRFRAVSKLLKSFIDSSEFIAGYRARKVQPHSLLLRFREKNYGVKYVSVNNDTFTQQQDLAPNISALMKQFNNNLKVIGSSCGLLCLYAFGYKGGMLVLWNPSIRRSVGILAPSILNIFGFAVCPITNEPTIVKILNPWKVEVFTLSSEKWTVIQCCKPRESIALHEESQVVIDRCIYRVAYETICLPNGHFTKQYMIVSFDLSAKEFKTIDLPDKITKPFTSPVRFILSKLKGSLVVIVPHSEVKVWKMEPDCSFTLLFTINTPPGSTINDILGFRKNGELVIETQDWGNYWLDVFALEVYDPCSHHINYLGFAGKSSFFISSYKETLHLLNHSDSFVYS